LNPKNLTQWLERIYATAESEIDCEQLQAALPAYVDLELVGQDPAARFPQVKAHLAQCPDCAEEYEGLRKVAELESKGRLPKAEDSLEQFEESTTFEPV
jgi:predicted anti-sigma-YlaC factor YlaD